MRWKTTLPLIGCLTAASVLTSGDGAQARPVGAEIRFTPVNGGSDCEVSFEFRNQKTYSVYIDWYRSYSRRMGPYFWRRLANLSVGDGWEVKGHSTRRTTRLIRQNCSTRRAYRIRVHTDRDGDGNFKESSELTKEVYIPTRPSNMVEFTAKYADSLMTYIGI